MSNNESFPITFIAPESLTGTNAVVWLARDGRRTTTQIATGVRYTLELTPHDANALGATVILPPWWTARLAVPRRESFLHAHSNSDVVLVLDDGRKVLGALKNVRGWRTVHAELRIAAWLEDWQ